MCDVVVTSVEASALASRQRHELPTAAAKQKGASENRSGISQQLKELLRGDSGLVDDVSKSPSLQFFVLRYHERLLWRHTGLVDDYMAAFSRPTTESKLEDGSQRITSRNDGQRQ